MTSKIQPFIDVSPRRCASKIEDTSTFISLQTFHKGTCVSECSVSRNANTLPPSHIVQETLGLHNEMRFFSEFQIRRELGLIDHDNPPESVCRGHEHNPSRSSLQASLVGVCHHVTDGEVPSQNHYMVCLTLPSPGQPGWDSGPTGLSP